jgi:Outer membrane protein beta-barrel domain
MLAKITMVTVALCAGLASTSLAQSNQLRTSPTVEIQSGWVGFADESTIDHAAFGGAARFYLTPRLAVGPEVAFLRGPGDDRDLMVTGNLTFDVLGPRNGRPRRVTPYLLAGGGWERHSDRFGPMTFSASEGAFTAGGGMRVWFTDTVYGAIEARMGWEPHARLSGGIGVAIR